MSMSWLAGSSGTPEAISYIIYHTLMHRLNLG
jgi:hypothetical protein